MVLSCRFYAERFPDPGDAVMVNIRSIQEMGVYVSLLEYNNIGELYKAARFAVISGLGIVSFWRLKLDWLS